MDQRLQGRIAVITGASSGLGRATAFKFANSGARVVCADLKASGVAETITKRHGKESATFIACNVGEESEIQSLIQQAVQWGGRLDIICNYAGIAVETKYDLKCRAHDLETNDFDQAMGVNCRGVWLCCKYALKEMLSQEPREPNARGERTRGWIVNAASMLGTVGLPNAPAYVTSKHAVIGLTKQMALDYAEDRIHINSVCPGFVDTAMIASMMGSPEGAAALTEAHPWKSLGRAEDVADAAMFLVSEESAWMTGHSMIIDGGYTCQ